MNNREIDILIHEKLFNQCGHVLTIYKKDNKNAWMDDYTNYRCKKCKESFRGLAYSDKAIVCPYYTNNLNEAFKAMNKMFEWLLLDYSIERTHGYHGPKSICIIEGYDRFKYKDVYYEVEDDSLARAMGICILQAIGVKVK